MHLKIPPLALTGIFAALMFVLFLLLPQFTLTLPGNNIVAILFAITGASISVMGVVSFRHAKTTVNPTKLNQSSSLVVKGIYRVSRNPMYLGFLLFLIAFGVYLANVIALLISPPAFVVYMNKFQIIPEEKALFLEFGEEYVSYKSAVRRWL
jgi:protein-S-isoprenylcysteine O-methyltransferase Ste14